MQSKDNLDARTLPWQLYSHRQSIRNSVVPSKQQMHAPQSVVALLVKLLATRLILRICSPTFYKMRNRHEKANNGINMT